MSVNGVITKPTTNLAPADNADLRRTLRRRIHYLKRVCKRHWKGIVLVSVPIILTPVLITDWDSHATRCAVVLLLMAIYWITEAVPIPVTALIPMWAFPALGVLSTGEVTKVYMKETNAMFLGGLMVIIAIEYCGLHERIAFRALLLVGTAEKWLMLGFMSVTMLLSMWISNTATTALMVPVVEAVLNELYKPDEVPESPATMSHAISNGKLGAKSLDDKLLRRKVEDVQTEFHSGIRHSRAGLSMVDLEMYNSTWENELDAPDEDDEDNDSEEEPPPRPQEELRPNVIAFKRARNLILCGVAYAANIGGTGSLTGTGPNLVVKGLLDELLSSSSPGTLKPQLMKEDLKERAENARKIIQKRYDDLGPLTIFRSPRFMPGWADDSPVNVGGATPAIFIGFLLFALPAHPTYMSHFPKFLRFAVSRPGQPPPRKGADALITWSAVHERMPWGVLILIGGGFALSEAVQKSGLSNLLGDKLEALSSIPPGAFLLIVTLATSFLTEVTSSTAFASIIIPILLRVSESLRLNPLYLSLPCAISCSYAFMLPAATPPNAIVYHAAQMNSMDLIRNGFVLNIVCVLVINLMTISLGNVFFDINTYPSWAENVTSVEYIR
ncbi:unnamed protein product [Cyprideis torosa]|uniref:Uncharacterized protein n=1 Tax=Cyprideis torosa TaxID=163714 RepID=A0A7R8WAJ9_9CRUS|nr:unnamed protein product [Cyprideis torosa]CAG0885548.1 unnamed protein product [Cyprideis torosa]